ncbi:MAG: hypothetical protein AAGE65_00880 [Planctomycetota bacterium]
MSQAMSNPVAPTPERSERRAIETPPETRTGAPAWPSLGSDTERWRALHRPSRRRTVGAFRSLDDAPYEGDLHLLDGRGWWQPWTAAVMCLAVPVLLKLVPGRPWWEFGPAFAVIAVGLVVAYRGWKVGNPIQKVGCVLVGLGLLALGAKLGDWTMGMLLQGGSLPQMEAPYQL